MRRSAANAAAAVICGIAALVAAPAVAFAKAPLKLSVTAAAMYAPATGQMLYGVNANRERAIASTTKLMTALVVLQHVHDLQRVFVYPNYHTAASDSQIGLQPGERMTVHDLLVAMMLPSADDAAEDLAYNVGHGSVGRFVAMMNREARKLGLRHTHYSTPIGLDTPGNYSTAADLVRLAAYDLSHSAFFARTVARPSAVLRTGPEHYVTNLNTLVGRVPWIDGVKTGHTNDAGYVLVASGHRDGMRLITAVLGTDSETARATNTMALMDYGYGNFRSWTPVRSHQVVARPAIEHRPGVHVPVYAAASFTRILPRHARVRLRADVPARLAGPLPRGTVVGSAKVVVNGRVVKSVPVVLERTLPAVSGLTLAARTVTKPLTLVLIAIVVALAVVALVVVRRRGGSGGSGRPGSGSNDPDWEVA
ncbi:MAG TPA: D-alanyl-D-alanine carboxypeptidase family protein [Solirubrobacteraceae bacterium]|nr:D-alanyl-D-alanine carboxypeptidase family protein [Solirubrobacteraceae bacterium]